MKDGGSYSRALVKISGGAFGREGASGFDREQLNYVCGEIKDGLEVCPELAVVVGGGNIMRGASFQSGGPGRLRADSAGMLATIVNGLIVKDCFLQQGVEVALYSALPVPEIAPGFDRDSCDTDLKGGKIVLLAGGTGNPLFTTDTAAALRAVQLEAEVVLKATRVDGVYSADPEVDNDATFYEHLQYDRVLADRLGVIDLCAVSLCMEHSLPVRVFNYKTPGNLRRALAGESVGTLIGEK
ncbi:MAG: uridine monophosphate kinase [Candidatus Brocadiia bacterium]